MWAISSLKIYVTVNMTERNLLIIIFLDNREQWKEYSILYSVKGDASGLYKCSTRNVKGLPFTPLH